MGVSPERKQKNKQNKTKELTKKQEKGILKNSISSADGFHSDVIKL